jgi:hypothetical protein
METKHLGNVLGRERPDTYQRATQQEELVNDMKKFAKEFYQKFRETQLKENK